MAKAKNRRVLVEIFPPQLNEKIIVGSPIISFTLTVDKGAIFKYPSGTEISIPPNAFVFADGSPVTGKVDFSYKEYRTKSDFVFGNIPMNFLNDQKEMLQFNS